MDISQFTQAIGRMTARQIETVAAALTARHATPAGDVAWWQATMAVEKALRVDHRTRDGAMAALAAARAIQSAAAHCEPPPCEESVRLVARAATDVARGLIAGPAAAGSMIELLACWTHIVSVNAAA